MRLALYSAALLLCVSLAVAVAPPGRTDLYGDPLPEGAIARFGSVRLRHAGLNDFVCLPGSKNILTAGRDRTLRTWDVKSGRQVRAVNLQGKAGAGGNPTLSPDGKTLVTTDQGKLVFWEVETGKELTSLPVPKGGGYYLYFSPDGKTLAVGRGVMHVSLLDWKAGKERELPLPLVGKQGTDGMADSSNHGQFSPDGKWFVAAGNSRQPVGVFDAATGREVYRFTCHPTASAVSPDGKTLAVSSSQNDKGGREAVIRFFDLTTGKQVRQAPQGHDISSFWLTFSPDGKTLACGFSDRSCLLDGVTGKVLHRLTGPRTVMMAFTPDGKTLVANGGRLHLWDVATGKELHDRPGDFERAQATAISPDGRQLASAGWLDQEVSLWDLTTGRLVRRFPWTHGEKRCARSLAFSTDGRTLFAGQGSGGGIQSWDVATGKELRTTQLKNDPADRISEYLYFYQFHLSPDAKHVSALQRVFGQQGEFTRLGRWEIGTGKLIRQHTLPQELREAAWRLDGKAVALLLPEGLTLLDIERGAVRFRAAEATSGPLAASPDYRLFAARRTSGGVGVWESATGKEVAAVAAGSAAQLALMPDNRCLVTTDEEFLRVWDLATGKERKRWPLSVTATSGKSGVTHLRLTPDGRRAFTAMTDGTGLVWNLTPALESAVPLAKSPGKKEFDAWWADLAGADAGRAYAAVWRLAELPEDKVLPLLKNLRPAGEPDAKEIRKLIETLDSDDFETREKAYTQLEKLGRAVAPLLRQALEKKPALEVTRRVEKLLARADSQALSSDELRRERAVQVLERIGTKEARRLLFEVNRGTIQP